MAYVKNTAYIDIPFSNETASGDFYIFSSLRDLAEKCELDKESVTRCRSIGILQSLHGKFYLSEVDPVANNDKMPLVRLSVMYLKAPLPSTVIPYPVQVFGSMQWKNRPVIYAKIVQVLTAPMALRLNSTMTSISSMHLARKALEHREDLDTSCISIE